MPDLIQQTEKGLYCEAGGFYIDPWSPVDRAVITHAHSDHARAGSHNYLAAESGVDILRERIGTDASIQGVKFGEPIDMNGVRVSLHPAGHLLGSAQIRIEGRGEVWVASGDYKLHVDPTCEPFEPVKCDMFLTESTFALPIYRWAPPQELFSQINMWWRENQQRKTTSIIFGYALGKAQRILSGIDSSIGPIIAHGAVVRFVEAYRRAGIKMPEVLRAEPEIIKKTRGSALVIAPPSATNTPWLRKFGRQSSAFASGWMAVRGNRRRANVDRGFALSDHADWNGLLDTIHATGARNIGVTHGSTEALARYLNENGYSATVYRTRFSDQGEEEGELTTETQSHGEEA